MYSTTTNVNVANINRVIEFIEGEERPFYMGAWNYCIAGQTLAAHNLSMLPPVDMRAAAVLGLAEYKAYKLFICIPDNKRKWRGTNRKDACAVLRHLAATGEVDWSVIRNRSAHL